MKVNWDDYSQYMEKQKMFQTTNQITDNDIWDKPTVYPSYRLIGVYR